MGKEPTPEKIYERVKAPRRQQATAWPFMRDLAFIKDGSASSNPIARSNVSTISQSCISKFGSDPPSQILALPRNSGASLADDSGASLADVERMALLQVEMQMGAMHVIGLRPKHGGEHLAGPVMHPAQEFGLWQ